MEGKEGVPLTLDMSRPPRSLSIHLINFWKCFFLSPNDICPTTEVCYSSTVGF